MNEQTLFQHRVCGFLPTIAMLFPLGVVAACSNDASSTPTSIAQSSSASFGKNVSGSTQRILFETNRDGNFEVYSIKPDGSEEIRLTNDVRTDQDAVWSPDGKRIAFSSARDNPFGEIYVMNADGTEVVRLTNSPGLSREPSWSKDGKQIVFASTRGASNPSVFSADDFDLYVMNADGSNVVRLTDNRTNDQSPVFSPDGRSIAFVSGRDHPRTVLTELYLMNVDGTNATRLTFQDALVSHPSWDPHGRRLAFGVFAINTSPAPNGIYALSLDILGFTRLTSDTTRQDDFPSWSPDGSKLVFGSFRDGNEDIFVMNADGTGETRLTLHPSVDALPRWSR